MEAPTNTYPDSMGGGSQTPPPAVPPPSSSGPSKKTLISIGAVVVVVLVLVAALLHPGIRAWISSLTGMSLSERAVLVKGTSDDGSVALYALKNGAVVPAEFPEGLSLVSDRGGMKAGLMGTDIVLIKGKKTDPRIVDPEYKEGLTVSPDGMWVAFASMVPGTAESGISRWYVKNANLETGEIRIVGTGYAPQYVLRDGKSYLLYTTTEGIAVADTSTGDVITTFATVGNTEADAVLASEDGKYLVIRDTVLGNYSLFAFEGVKENRISFSALRALPAEIVSVAFRGGTMYAVSKSEAGQELLVYASAEAAEPEKRIALPASGTSYEVLP